MSIWTEFRGEITLSGREYDGKGFGLRSAWTELFPDLYRFKTRFCVLRDGKLTRHRSANVFSKALRAANVPCGSEGGSVIDILESKIDGKVHITFDRKLRGYIDNFKIRDWIIAFVKARLREGWTVHCRISYGMDSSPKDMVRVHEDDQNCAVEERCDYYKDTGHLLIDSEDRNSRETPDGKSKTYVNHSSYRHSLREGVKGRPVFITRWFTRE